MTKQPKPKETFALDPLRLMVRRGQLFKVQEWIRAGNPLCDETDRRPNVLLMAVESGFHSMVEVLASAWPSRSGLDRALTYALEERRLDMAGTLMELDADLTQVPLYVIANTHDKDLMARVLGRWGEFDQENGLYEVVTSMPRPLTGLIRERRQEIPNSDQQLARAMKYFAQESHPLWVGLTVWMGGDPRLPCPSPGEEDEAREDWTTPLQFAVMLGRGESVRAMQVTPHDDLTALLGQVHCYFEDNIDLVKYLLSRGASPNNKPNGGSTVLERVLTPHSLFHYAPIDRGLVETLVVRHGAQFRPDESSNMRDLRASLSSLSAYSLRGLLVTLLPAMTDETLLKLVNTPKMRELLGLKSMAELRYFLERLRHPDSKPPNPHRTRKKSSRPEMFQRKRNPHDLPGGR